MPTIPATKLLLALLTVSSLAACGSGSNTVPETPAPVTPPAAQEPGDAFVLTQGGRLASFNRETPATIRTNVTVSGLQAGESLLGIDFRPADGLLYALGSTGRLYTLNPASGAATFKSTLVADGADTTAPYTGLSGTDFGFDFNPVADRLRVVSNTGQSLRINVDTGATTTDGAINGGAANTFINASAYTNSFAGTGSTTLYAIDAANSSLYIQNPPNNGTLSAPVSLGVSAIQVGGFDIDPRTNVGYAVMRVGGARNLYTINLAASSNPAQVVAAIGVGEDINGLAIRTPAAATVFGLTEDGRMVSFRSTAPSAILSNVSISGLGAGERLLGFDVRPKDGLLYGMTSAGRIVTIDTATGAAILKATLAADAADTSAPYAGVLGTAFAVDFNPVADRLRVISDLGQSLRINVDTGAVTTDGVINRVGASPLVSAAAYTNSFAGTTSTQLFDIDTASDSLALQNPPNDGTLVNVGALGLDPTGDGGFDIAGGANGLALAALRIGIGAPSSLYRIDLVTGAATPVISGNAQIGSGLALIDLAIVLK